jgi:site-specific recombinase XerC
MTRQNYILHNPASEIDLPRLGRTLPKNIPSPQEVEQIVMQPDITEPMGLRDRAILELQPVGSGIKSDVNITVNEEATHGVDMANRRRVFPESQAAEPLLVMFPAAS